MNVNQRYVKAVREFLDDCEKRFKALEFQVNRLERALEGMVAAVDEPDKPRSGRADRSRETGSGCPKPTCSPLKAMTWSDIEAAAAEHGAKMDAIFKHDKKLGYITINAVYPYHIKLSRIPDPEGLVHWIEHLTGKNWMTGDLVRELIRRVYAIKGWDLHRRNL